MEVPELATLAPSTGQGAADGGGDSSGPQSIRSEACVSGRGTAFVLGALLQGETMECERGILTSISLIPLLRARTVKRCLSGLQCACKSLECESVSHSVSV